ncbi:FMN-binding negative transcriptional regulator [Jannaschia pohangensis]|uniref:Negative transcriptional regulator, PaiB family n=1 Tax=Jannaschia pohangensis TaxID=390807 RepID=A0A1I3T851_9RHOB|nr:FMN-binding negative transcriptional regulator [Jannaschia pohangensis]SFJ66763.1 negative transcriptional regulator, PaiB family [Jannaschia pohangensis]
MHPNPAFRQTPEARALAFAAERGFGILSVNADPSPLLAHIPFLLSPDGASADLHLVRSNPILRLLDCPAVIAVSGPDAYISPDWYEVTDQVPTWNYVGVHLRGRLTRLPDEAMRDMLDRQSAAYEHRLTPKAPWTADKMTPDVLTRMMRQIVPCRFLVEEVQSTWKLGQNKPEAVRLAAAEQVETSGIGSETLLLSALMKSPE